MPNANFVHRIFHLKTSNCILPERTIHQVHFTSWPDHGVPDTVFPLLSFMNYVAEIQSTGPIIVHCRFEISLFKIQTFFKKNLFLFLVLASDVLVLLFLLTV